MKSIIIGLIVIVTSLIALRAEANYGICDYGKETLDAISCAGVATLNGTTVQNKVTVEGPLTATNAHLNTVEVMGVAKLENTVVTGEVEVMGYFIADHCTFSSSLSIKSDDVRLTASTLLNPTAPLKIYSSFKTPVLYLKSGSQVDTVIFENHAGIVKVDADSKVNQVTNGQVIKM